MIRPSSLFLHSGVRLPFLAVLLAAGMTVVHRQTYLRRRDVAGHVAFWVLLSGLVYVGDVRACRLVLERWGGHAPA